MKSKLSSTFKMLALTLMLLLGVAPAGAQSCPTVGPQGYIGMYTLGSCYNPPSYITKIQGNGNNTLTVFSTWGSATTQRTFTFTGGSVTITGSWTGTRATSISTSGNQLTVNGTSVITFNGLSLGAVSKTWGGSSGGLTLVSASGNTNQLHFNGYDRNTCGPSGVNLAFSC